MSTSALTPEQLLMKERHQVVGECHWERDDEADRLVDEAGTVWQTFYRGGPQDTWAGSIQRHETMGDE